MWRPEEFLLSVQQMLLQHFLGVASSGSRRHIPAHMEYPVGVGKQTRISHRHQGAFGTLAITKERCVVLRTGRALESEAGPAEIPRDQKMGVTKEATRHRGALQAGVQRGEGLTMGAAELLLGKERGH